MNKKKIYLILQTVLCIMLAAALTAAAWQICRSGTVRKEENPLAWIYTQEETAKKLAHISPLFFAGLGMAAAGLILGVKDDRAQKPDTNRRIQTAGRPASRKTAKEPGLLPVFLLMGAVALIIAGAVNGSARDVLYKAANICTECIGLG